MTDSQILLGIMQNDERAWKHICRNMKPGFASILGQTSSLGNLTNEDIEDVFQESMIVLLQKVKSFMISVTIWQETMRNAIWNVHLKHIMINLEN